MTKRDFFAERHYIANKEKQTRYLELFRAAERVGVTAACRQAGVGRTSYYKMLKRYRETGTVKDLSRARKNPPSISAGTVKAVDRCKAAHAGWGAKRISVYLMKRRKLAVSASAIERLWRRRRLAEQQASEQLEAALNFMRHRD